MTDRNKADDVWIASEPCSWCGSFANTNGISIWCSNIHCSWGVTSPVRATAADAMNGIRHDLAKLNQSK